MRRRASRDAPRLTMRARRHVKSMEFSVIVFDTAPTGHTLRFLSFPTVLEKALGKLSTLGSRFGPMINQMSAMMGGQPGSQEDMFAKLESMRAVITEVNNQLKDPVRLSRLAQPISTALTQPARGSRTNRKRRRSFACAYPSSCRCTRQNVSSKNSPRTRSTRIT